jgi:predicted nucleic acid-binding protein
MNRLEPEDLYLSVVSIGEITFGLERLPSGKKKSELSYFCDTQIPEWFGNRILPLDGEVMREWGKMCVRTGKTLSTLDSLIAATALVYRLTILTRNIRDFESIEGLLLVNPWEEE